MDLRPLGRSGMHVTSICLGTMTWGQQNTEAEAHAQLDYALERGVNFIDTAEMYPVPPEPATQGRTETYIGSWIKKRKNRDKFILASKVAGRGRGMTIRGQEPRLSRAQIFEAIEQSLKRLQTDYVDLYQTHWTERNVNNFGRLGYAHDPSDNPIALEETFAALSDLVKAGKVRALGLSNDTPWGVMQCLRLAETQNVPRIASIQNPYNLLNRSFEIGLSEIAHREDVGLLAYSPLAMGMLTGKYEKEPWPANARMTLFSRYTRYSGLESKAPVAAYIKLARDHGLDPGQMALAYVRSRSFVTSAIIGATNLDQLKSNIDSTQVQLTAAVLEGIEAIHKHYPNVCP